MARYPFLDSYPSKMISNLAMSYHLLKKFYCILESSHIYVSSKRLVTSSILWILNLAVFIDQDIIANNIMREALAIPSNNLTALLIADYKQCQTSLDHHVNYIICFYHHCFFTKSNHQCIKGRTTFGIILLSTISFNIVVTCFWLHSSHRPWIIKWSFQRKGSKPRLLVYPHKGYE